AVVHPFLPSTIRTDQGLHFMDQPFDKRNDNPEAPDLEAPKSDDNNFGITAKDNKAAEKKPAEKKVT
ncbi:MAG: hypothetical protein Q4F51_04565, partial [Sarcina sp.]|nr:hypothetical protein [Sarcina sp.]